MIQVVGSATHLENRSGEPAANPYLYMASQIVSGWDGVERRLPLPEPTQSPYHDAGDRLPASRLAEALTAVEQDPLFSARFGECQVAWLQRIKRFEWIAFWRRSPTGNNRNTLISSRELGAAPLVSSMRVKIWPFG